MKARKPSSATLSAWWTTCRLVGDWKEQSCCVDVLPLALYPNATPWFHEDPRAALHIPAAMRSKCPISIHEYYTCYVRCMRLLRGTRIIYSTAPIFPLAKGLTFPCCMHVSKKRKVRNITVKSRASATPTVRDNPTRFGGGPLLGHESKFKVAVEERLRIKDAHPCF